MPTAAWVIFIVGAAWGWVGGILFRAGYLRRIGRIYFDPDKYGTPRNTPMMAIPAACAFTSLLVCLLLLRADSAVSGIFLLLFFVFGIWMVVVLFRAPEFLKPRWLREEEQRRNRNPSHGQ